VSNLRMTIAMVLLAASAAYAAQPISIVEVRSLPLIEAPQASHEFSLHAHTFRGTRWQPEDIAAAISGSARLLAQCGVALAVSDLRVIEAPRAFHYYHTATSRRLLQILDSPRPAVFFVEDTRNTPAFDAEAVGVANARSRPELANTVWVAHGARDLPQAIAHELVHVLSDNGSHSTERGNLMQDETSPGNERLTQRQCDLLRSRGEANGLLRKRS
jgi:hypothetical protein